MEQPEIEGLINFLLLTQKKPCKEYYYYYKGTNYDSFHGMLYRLICKADPFNRRLLEKGFPMEVFLILQSSTIPNWHETFMKMYENRKKVVGDE